MKRRENFTSRAAGMSFLALFAIAILAAAVGNANSGWQPPSVQGDLSDSN